MEALDVMFLTMKDIFSNVDFGKPIKVDYVYNRKSVDVGYADWILLYSITDDIRWLGIETSLYSVESVVAVDVRTQSKVRYGKIREHILKNFSSEKLVFNETGNVVELTQNYDFGWYDNLGFYVDKVELYNVNGLALNRGDRVILHLEDGSNVSGWVWDLYDDGLYIFKRPSVVWLVNPVRVTELSDKMKGLYRFVMDVNVRVFER